MIQGSTDKGMRELDTVSINQIHVHVKYLIMTSIDYVCTRQEVYCAQGHVYPYVLDR